MVHLPDKQEDHGMDSGGADSKPASHHAWGGGRVASQHAWALAS